MSFEKENEKLKAQLKELRAWRDKVLEVLMECPIESYCVSADIADVVSFWDQDGTIVSTISVSTEPNG
jgi:hypothetical protein